MAYDEKLAARIDLALHGWPGISTKKMFGSIGWMLNGNICAGIWRDSLIVRCGPDEWPQLLRLPHVSKFDITGRSMKGWLLVGPLAMANEADLGQWMRRSREFVRTLPARLPGEKSKPRADQANAKPGARSTTRSVRGRRAR